MVKESSYSNIRLMQRKNIFVQLFCIFLSVLIIIILLQKVEINIIVELIKSIDKANFFFSIVCMGALVLVAAPIKWKYFMMIFGAKMSFRESVFVKVSCIPLKFIFPFRSNELIRCAYFNRRHGVSVAKCGASLILSIILAVWVLFVFWMLGVCARTFGFFTALTIISLVNCAVAGVVVWLYRVYQGKFGFDINIVSIKFLLFVIILNVLVIGCDIGMFYFISRSFGFNISLWYLVEIFPIVLIVAKLPVFYNGIGGREF